MKNTLGLTIRRRRKALRMMEKDFASRCGVTIQTVYYWEHGQRYPSMKKLWAIANALAMNIEDLTIFTIESHQ